MFERFRARGDDGGLQPGGSVVLDSRSVGEKASNASRCGRQAGVGVQKQAECFCFSGHGCWPEKRRKLPGNLDNSRGRRSTGVRSSGPCRWCNIFRRSSDLPASRIARKGSDLAWEPLEKTLPEQVRMRQGEGGDAVRVIQLRKTVEGFPHGGLLLTSSGAHASIGFCLRHWTGIRRNSSQERAS